MSHWMAQAARRAGFEGADTLSLPAEASVEELWSITAEACGVGVDDLARAVAATFSMDVADLEAATATATKLLPASVVKKYAVFPLRDEHRSLLVATANPVDTNANQEVGFASGRNARFEIAPPSRIQEAIEAAYAPDAAAASMLSQMDDKFREVGDVQIDLTEDEEPEAISEVETASGPIVKLANIVLHEAISRGASDIHIQPMAGNGIVRFRTDGVLQNGMQVPLQVMTRIVSRIKIMARLDITDRLRPQDGRAKVVVDGRKYDLRVSTVPTRQAEKAVIRILDTQGAGTLSETGIAEAQVARIRKALTHREGIVVVTGPTGSGKTTTMYGALQEIATEDINIMTVEDPVEYELPRLTQIQVEHKQGMSFASALRAILRQDPDVIFVGEIRDAETAEIAAQASLTGHLVLATLHTNDAVGAIRRFLDLGLDIGTIGETMRGALAQRLVRKVCTRCTEDVGGALTPAEEALAAQYGCQPRVRAVGCEHCGDSGYSGRLPLTEFLTTTPALVDLMLAEASSHELQAQARKDGMTTLLESALDRVVAGETTLEEVERVVGLSEQEPDERTVPEVSAPVEEISGPLGNGKPMENGRPAAASPSTNGLASTNGHRPVAVTLEGPSLDGGAGADADPDQPHILLVDDDGTTRTIARALIEKHLGFRVSESPDGSDALLRFARGEVFSLMVLDLDMPTLGGREVLRSVRQSMVTAGLPVVVLTGTPDPDSEIELIEMGADDYLRKPLDPARLQTRIKAALRRAQG